jgi:hypothetical protein
VWPLLGWYPYSREIVLQATENKVIKSDEIHPKGIIYSLVENGYE